MPDNRQATALAFSCHRFAEAYPALAEDVRWELIGGPTLQGKQAVVDACRETLAMLSETRTTFTRVRTVVGADAVVIDTTATYVGPDGGASIVASCDLFDFTGEHITAITSYTSELSSS